MADREMLSKPRNKRGYEVMKGRKGGPHEDQYGQKNPKRARIKEAEEDEIREELRELGIHNY